MTDTRDKAFAESIAARLREPVHLSAELDARVMATVRAESRARTQRGWFSRPRVLLVSPLVGLAAAAGFAAIVVLGAWAAASKSTATTAQHATAAHTELVRFVLVEPEASHVSLVGDFNGWDEKATHLQPGSSEGVWVATVRVPAGRHEYAFVVRTNGDKRWVADPYALARADDFGTTTSVVTVGESGSTTTARGA